MRLSKDLSGKEKFLQTDRRGEIREASMSQDNHFLWHAWQQWYDRGILQSDYEASDNNLAMGITGGSVQAELLRPLASSRHAMQAAIVRAICGCLPPAQARFMVKLRR